MAWPGQSRTSAILVNSRIVLALLSIMSFSTSISRRLRASAVFSGSLSSSMASAFRKSVSPYDVARMPLTFRETGSMVVSWCLPDVVVGCRDYRKLNSSEALFWASTVGPCAPLHRESHGAVVLRVTSAFTTNSGRAHVICHARLRFLTRDQTACFKGSRHDCQETLQDNIYCDTLVKYATSQHRLRDTRTRTFPENS